MQSLGASFEVHPFFRDLPLLSWARLPTKKGALSGPLAMILLPTVWGNPDGGYALVDAPDDPIGA